MEKTITKTNGNCEIIEIPNPDYYQFDNEEHRIKKRHKATNFTPKKKKRKK